MVLNSNLKQHKIYNYVKMFFLDKLKKIFIFFTKFLNFKNRKFFTIILNKYLIFCFRV